MKHFVHLEQLFVKKVRSCSLQYLIFQRLFDLNYSPLSTLNESNLTLLVRRFQIYRTSYATFIFNVIQIVQKRLENGSFDGSRCVLYNAFVLARRIDLDVATNCYFDKFMIFFTFVALVSIYHVVKLSLIQLFLSLY